MKPDIRLLLSAVILLASAQAMAEERWTTANLAMADEHIVPRYQALAEAGTMLEQRVRALCEAPSQITLDAAREGFHLNMDGWQGIQHMRFGPVELFLRYHRFQLWPDKHATGAKQLRAMLAAEDSEQLSPERFRHTSAAVQGLSSLERLLFANQGPAAYGSDGQPSYRCQLTEAIAHNLAAMAQSIVNDWTQGKEPYRQDILTAAQGNDYFDSDRELSAKLLNNLHTQLQAIVDQKLLRPMDESAEKAKPRRAESWRSRRSLRNIVINLEACEEIYRVGFAPLLADRELDRQIRDAFVETLAAARRIEQPLHTLAADASRRPALDELLAHSRQLKSLIGGSLPRALDLPLGFNSLDGD